MLFKIVVLFVIVLAMCFWTVKPWEDKDEQSADI